MTMTFPKQSGYNENSPFVVAAAAKSRFLSHCQVVDGNANAFG